MSDNKLRESHNIRFKGLDIVTKSAYSLGMASKRTFPDLPTFLRETGTTQQQLARTLGISQSYISRLIHGIQGPPLWLALRISRIARVPVESLVRRVDRDRVAQ